MRSNPSSTRRNRAPRPIHPWEVPSRLRGGPKAALIPARGKRPRDLHRPHPPRVVCPQPHVSPASRRARAGGRAVGGKSHCPATRVVAPAGTGFFTGRPGVPRSFEDLRRRGRSAVRNRRLGGGKPELRAGEFRRKDKVHAELGRTRREGIQGGGCGATHRAHAGTERQCPFTRGRFHGTSEGGPKAPLIPARANALGI